MEARPWWRDFKSRVDRSSFDCDTHHQMLTIDRRICCENTRAQSLQSLNERLIFDLSNLFAKTRGLDMNI